jgi:tetratricopeptide (TPR) repeat protein
MTDADRASAAKQHYEMAVSLHRRDKLDEAAQQYRAVLEIFPAHPGTLQGLGLIARRNQDFSGACELLQRAHKVAPDNAPIACDLGTIYLKLGRYGLAHDVFERVLAHDPRNIPALLGAGDALSILGRAEDAIAVYQRVLALDANNAVAQFGLGNALAQLGRDGEARAAFERAVALMPQNAVFHRALAEAARFVPGDPRLAAMEALQTQSLPDALKIELHFALAKAYDDLGRHADAPPHFVAGNTLMRKHTPYNEGAVANFFRDVKQAFTPEVMAHETGDPSPLPIFIVGMPRSGTSLVEQILASNPHVYGAGELAHIPDMIADGLAGDDYPHGIAALSDQRLRALGREYLKRLRPLPPGTTHVIDKLPANARNIGLIRLVLPNARIIHLRRDAMDTCFSCYSKLFLNGLNYTYDLSELGRYYRLTEDLMAHWRSVLPEGAMLEVQYEDLVRDFEHEARRLVEFCGLEWSDRFASFHQTDRPVRTLSRAQVREPLFDRSIGRWRHYEEMLKPLAEVLHG